MHGQSPASPEGGRYLSRVGGGVVALGQTGERHPWILNFNRWAVIGALMGQCGAIFFGKPESAYSRLCREPALRT